MRHGHHRPRCRHVSEPVDASRASRSRFVSATDPSKCLRETSLNECGRLTDSQVGELVESCGLGVEEVGDAALLVERWHGELKVPHLAVGHVGQGAARGELGEVDRR